MISCCPPHPMRWNAVTGAIARCKNRSTGYARKRRSVHAWRWICGVKPKPKAVNKPSPHFIVHGLDKPGVFTTDSTILGLGRFHDGEANASLQQCQSCHVYGQCLPRRDAPHAHALAGVQCDRSEGLVPEPEICGGALRQV